MKRSYFFTIATILLSTISIPTMTMESVTTTEKAKFVVTLHLSEVTQKYMERPSNKFFDKYDEHTCAILGIKWEDNNNKYWTDSALLKNANDTQDFCCWTKIHPRGIPFSTVPNHSYMEPFQYLVKFPKSLPATFVEKLKKEKSITLENTLFAEPVDITLQLGSIKKIDNQ